MNEVVIGSNARVLDMPEEQQLTEQVGIMNRSAGELVISNDSDCAMAAKMLDDVKKMEKRVTDYWEPMRSQTYAAYKSVNEHKAEMLEPLKKSEKKIQNCIDKYVSEKNRRLREKEEMIRSMAQKEVERKISEAIEAEKRGDIAGREYAMAEAEIADSVSVMKSRNVSVDGVSIGRKTWVIDSLNPEMVPITVCGVTVLIKDKSTVERVVKQVISQCNGNITIPGVLFHEKYTVKTN